MPYCRCFRNPAKQLKCVSHQDLDFVCFFGEKTIGDSIAIALTYFFESYPENWGNESHFDSYFSIMCLQDGHQPLVAV